MVPKGHNGWINTMSQHINENGVNPSPAAQLLTFMDKLNRNMEEFFHDIRRNQVTLDFHETDSGGTIDLTNRTSKPYKLTDILANWYVPNESSSSAYNTVGGPTAGQTIVSLTLPGGVYNVQWQVGLGGTTGATENNNFELQLNGVAIETAMSSGGSGSFSTQTPVQVEVPESGGTISINAIVAGTSTAVYRGNLTATQQTIDSVTITIGDRVFTPNPGVGSFAFTGMTGMQVQPTDKVKLVVTPASQAYFEVIGYSDYRKIDRQ